MNERDEPAPIDIPTPTTAESPPQGPAGSRMPSPLVVVAIGLVAVALLAYGQHRTVSRLDSEVEALKEGQRKLAVGLGEARGRADAAPVFIDVANLPALGPDTAVVTLVEFSDYECPFCIRHFQLTFPQVEARYIREGKIRYVFRDFPIDDNHPQAVRAHEAARCADEQHKFWTLHRQLFSPPGTHGTAALDKRAKDAGLDLPAFQACVASGRTTADVRASIALAEHLGAEGTPAFFIGLRDFATNRVRVVDTLNGAQPFSAFERALDAAIAQARAASGTGH